MYNQSVFQTKDSIDTGKKGNFRPYALIAGGSKGIGYAIAQAFAKRSYNLVLIARHLDCLMSAKNRLESAYGISVEVIVQDLSFESSADEIANWCTQKNIPLKALCNVAGYGGEKDYLSSLPLDSLRYMINLNASSCIALTYKLLPLLRQNRPAYILNVASMAGFAPIPIKNLYSATKSFIIFFSYSLRYQLKEQNISISCLAPGPVFTKPAIAKDTKDKLGWFGMKMAMHTARVGEIAVRKTLDHKMIIVPGTLARASSILIRLLPRKFVTCLYNKVGKKE
jgi:uncharacterized protein